MVGPYVTACHRSCKRAMSWRVEAKSERAWVFSSPASKRSVKNPKIIKNPTALFARDGSDSRSASNQSILVELQCLLPQPLQEPKKNTKYAVWGLGTLCLCERKNPTGLDLSFRGSMDRIKKSDEIWCDWTLIVQPATLAMAIHTSFSFHLGHFAEGDCLLESASNQQMKNPASGKRHKKTMLMA